jgi:hypothetical protein
MDDFEEIDRKEIRKNHISNRQRNKIFIDEDIKFASKSNKARKSKIQELEEEELYEEWEEYFNK